MSIRMAPARLRGALTIFLALFLLVGGVGAAGAHHDHAVGHDSGCPTCRLADDGAGAVPVPGAEVRTLRIVAPIEFRVSELVPAVADPRGAHHLRAPPIA